MTNRQIFQNYGIKRLKLAVLLFAILLMQIMANAQTALEQQCFNDVQGKVAWNKAGNKTWSVANVRRLCQETTNPGATIACFQEQIRQHDDWSRGITACMPEKAAAKLPNKIEEEKAAVPAGIDRFSFNSNPYVLDPLVTNRDKWEWSGGRSFEREIFNPLDGGVLLKYTQDQAQGNSDGCSNPLPDLYTTFFQQACFAHDTNYDAPFQLAGFPNYEWDGSSTGKDLADYLFLKDMLLLNKQRGPTPGSSLAESAAFGYYRAVQDFGGYRGSRGKQTILEKGGVVAVKNYGIYTMRLRVTWTSPKGERKTEEVLNVGGRAATIPLSFGARDIEVEATAVGGNQIFKRSLPQVGMYAFTVGGTVQSTNLEEGVLKSDFGDKIHTEAKKVVTFVKGESTPAGERAIKFNNQAFFVADMMVMFFVNQNVGGTNIPTPKILTTPKLTAGFTRPLIIPKDLAPNTAINVFIRGYGTRKDDVLSTTVKADFEGDLCFKAFGTIFSPQGSPCN